MEENGEAQLMASAEANGLEKLFFHKDTELILKSYGQEPYIYSNAKEHIELQHPTLNIATFGQFDVAVKLFTSPRLCNRGNISRIIPYVNTSTYLNKYRCYNRLYGNEDEIYMIKITKLYERFYTQDANAERYNIFVEKNGGKYIHSFMEELNNYPYNIEYLRPWVSKLHGQALRLALAFHLWENIDDPYGSPITEDEVIQGIMLAKTTINSARFLYSPHGITAALDAIKIIRSFQRINGINERRCFIQNGTDTTKIQQRTGISRININNALQYLSHFGWGVLFDDGSGKLHLLPHREFLNTQVIDL